MEIIQGKGVFGAVAVSKIFFYRRQDANIIHRTVSDALKEKERYENARDSSIAQLSALYEKALAEAGEESAQIFDIHRMMLDDRDYNDSVINIIETQLVNAEYAVSVTSENFAGMFSSMDDEYMQARSADVKDISDRIIRNLIGENYSSPEISEPCIICADDLTPSETLNMDKSRILAFATKHGSSTSHTAILARTMNIPAVVGLDGISEELDGKFAAIDGYTGRLYIEPNEETLALLTNKQEQDKIQKAILEQLKGKDNVTSDGRRIDIFANIGGPQDVDAVIANDAGGIGLFRSEFLYLESSDYPTEQVQLSAYRRVLEAMSGKKVVIRTMDIGADKQIGYFKLDKEENPALGYRAIRICLTRRNIFRTQLRALLRASVYGNLAVMFPMITSVEEVHEIKEIIDDVKSELASESIPFSDTIELGVMIETPAAAVISDILAQEVDFFSVGTNDLTQYTLAADRQNPKLEPFCDTHHEAVLRLIEYSAKSAHKYGKWIGICGELAADLSLTERWLRIGIDELSVSPAYILPLRDAVRKI